MPKRPSKNSGFDVYGSSIEINSQTRPLLFRMPSMAMSQEALGFSAASVCERVVRGPGPGAMARVSE